MSPKFKLKSLIRILIQHIRKFIEPEWKLKRESLMNIYLIWFPFYDNKDDPHAEWVLCEYLERASHLFF